MVFLSQDVKGFLEKVAKSEAAAVKAEDEQSRHLHRKEEKEAFNQLSSLDKASGIDTLVLCLDDPAKEKSLGISCKTSFLVLQTLCQDAHARSLTLDALQGRVNHFNNKNVLFYYEKLFNPKKDATPSRLRFIVETEGDGTRAETHRLVAALPEEATPSMLGVLREAALEWRNFPISPVLSLLSQFAGAAQGRNVTQDFVNLAGEILIERGKTESERKQALSVVQNLSRQLWQKRIKEAKNESFKAGCEQGLKEAAAVLPAAAPVGKKEAKRPEEFPNNGAKETRQPT